MEDILDVDVIKADVQKQNNTFDCGLFSLAFATSICYNIDPTNLYFNEKSLRLHFNKCIANRAVEQFPLHDDK